MHSYFPPFFDIAFLVIFFVIMVLDYCLHIRDVLRNLNVTLQSYFVAGDVSREKFCYNDQK